MSFKDKAQISPVLKRLIKSLETQFHLTYFCFNFFFKILLNKLQIA